MCFLSRGVAQLVEHTAGGRVVARSNRVAPTKKTRKVHLVVPTKIMRDRTFIPAFNYHFLTPFYDFLANILGFGITERKKILELLKIKPHARLFDAGCGTGSLLTLAKKRYPKNEMVGIDIDKHVLKIAKQKMKKDKVVVKLDRGSLDQLPYSDAMFDVVVSSLVFHHLPLDTKRKAMKEIKRVMKKRGRFLLVDFGKMDSTLIRFLYAIERLFHIKEAETLKDNLEGKLPELLNLVGFQISEVAPHYRGIHYILAKKR